MIIAHCLAFKTGPILMNTCTLFLLDGVVSEFLRFSSLHPSPLVLCSRSQHSQLPCGCCFSRLHNQRCALGAFSQPYTWYSYLVIICHFVVKCETRASYCTSQSIFTGSFFSLYPTTHVGFFNYINIDHI